MIEEMIETVRGYMPIINVVGPLVAVGALTMGAMGWSIYREAYGEKRDEVRRANKVMAEFKSRNEEAERECRQITDKIDGLFR